VVCSAVVTARFLKCVLLSHASHACDHTHTHTHTHTLQTIETTGQLPTPPACSTPIDRREVLRRSSGAARKDSCTACERTALKKMATPLVGYRLSAVHEDVGLGGQAKFILVGRRVCVSLFYVIDTGSIGSRARIEMGVTYLPSAFAQTLAMPIYP